MPKISDIEIPRADKLLPFLKKYADPIFLLFYFTNYNHIDLWTKVHEICNCIFFSNAQKCVKFVHFLDCLYSYNNIKFVAPSTRLKVTILAHIKFAPRALKHPP